MTPLFSANSLEPEPNGHLPVDSESPDKAPNQKIEIGDIIKEAWELKDGVKGSFLAASFLYYLFSLLSGFILSFIFNAPMEPQSIANLMVNFVVSFLLFPMLAGIFMMGIHRSLSRSVSFTIIFEFYSALIPIFLLALLGLAIVMIGFAALILPGIYLAVSYAFALPLLVDKNLGIWEALETSRKAVTRQWFKVFGLLLVLGGIILISVALFFIPLIWTIPFSYIAYGVAYRNLFGVTATLE